MLPISILKGSITLAGLLFHPQNITGTLPGLVIIHPGGGVKEQAASVYAEKLSLEGYVTIAYDAAHQDASAVIDYLETLDYVDPDRIAVLGICAGGGYAAAAAKGDHRLKAVATVSGVNIGDANREGWLGTEDKAGKITVLQDITGPIQAEANGTKPGYFNYVLPNPDENTPYDLRDAADYYLTPRAQHPSCSEYYVGEKADEESLFIRN